MKPGRISFHERVRIIACDDYPEYVGLEGYVSSMSIEDDGTVSGYGVAFEDDEIEGCGFLPEEIEGTGEVLSEENFMARFFGDPVFIKVRVDDEGNGTVVRED